jgi:hypothetical protein
MNKTWSLWLVVALLGLGATANAAENSSVLVLREPGFPTADSTAPPDEQLAKLWPGAETTDGIALGARLAKSPPKLLVLPYGSTFPEQAWPAIRHFLQRGGNLLAVGGRPFTRAAFRDETGWHLRAYSVRFARALMIDQYQSTPGSEGLDFLPNPALPSPLRPFQWKGSHSLVIRLSAVDLYKRAGSAGSIDARLDTLAWGAKDGVKLAAPVVQVDHLKNGFDGGRWILVNADLSPGFWTSAAADLLPGLAERALEGAEAFSVRPALPLYVAGEKVHLEVTWHKGSSKTNRARLKVAIFPEAQPGRRSVLVTSLPAKETLALPAPSEPGLYVVEAELETVRRDGKAVLAKYRSAFWMRDEDFLRSGPRLSVGPDYFQLDGKPLAVLGTTHMSSEVQRLFFEQPNVAVWDSDLAHIRGAGLNMVRTGWWSGWNKLCDGSGVPRERTLRTLEAYLMTARKHGLPVQFTFFAFLPEILGGANPYLDPEAVRRQQALVGKVVARFHAVPFVAWDLINEPSFSTRLWTTRPNGDAFERARWNQWLAKRYPDKAALAAQWNVPEAAVAGAATLPEDVEFWSRGVYAGRSSLRAYDYFLFAQESFAEWARGLREHIRAPGSEQPITIGQDEGGIQDRLSPAYWSTATDFTSNHSWWQNDALLWDSLAAKQPGQAMLIQETGLQRELTPDEVARRSLESEAALLERKLALAFARGAGAIEWLWHANAYMTESNETPIGAVRPDGTEKPEAQVMRRFAAFAGQLGPFLHDLAPAQVAVVTSQAAQFSVLADLQIEAQRKAVRALAYQARVLPAVIAENRLSSLGQATLAVLPSAQALTDDGWRTLLGHVERGGALLVTGPIERDEHWRVRPRAQELGLAAASRPLTYHGAELALSQHATVPLSFDQQKQSQLESLDLPDGATLREIRHGKGRIFWAADPVELAEGSEAAAALYRHVLGQLGIASRFEWPSDAPSGVLVCPIPLGANVLYIFASEQARDTKLDLIDKPTGVRIKLTLASEHAALALVDGNARKIVARYGF